MNHVFKPASILVPHTDLSRWSVVACDQYTSQPDYWSRVEKNVGTAPSTLHLTFPEIYLNSIPFPQKIDSINAHMRQYLDEDLFTVYDNAYFYIERTLANGAVRKGIVGMVDLECYDFQKGSQPLIRATEGTVLDRIPPRVKVRENAPLELPHAMLLIDDEERTVIEPLGAHTGEFQPVYDTPLMEKGGSIKGYLLPQAYADQVDAAIEKLADPADFMRKYALSPEQHKDLLLFAVGDGNHSLATAKQCYENLKQKLSVQEAQNHPARYALVELGNLHDESLQFEPVHRIVTGVKPTEFVDAFCDYYNTAAITGLDHSLPLAGQHLAYAQHGIKKDIVITNPHHQLTVGSVQEFIDDYIAKNPAAVVDYIHGEEALMALSTQPHSVGFLLPAMEKCELFKTVILDGALPRKTFSMGEANDKRYYLEARKIR